MRCLEAGLELADDLQKIYESWTDKEAITGHACEEGYMSKAIHHEDLPPIEGASKDNHHVYVYYKDDKLIGFTDVYIGYPDSSCLWIGLMIVDKNYRKLGYGREMIETLIKKYPSYHLGIGVDTKNLSGLKFWHKQGFNDLFAVHVNEGFGVLGLRRNV
ncbi:GNAT family N-acetyltransferase [Acidaminobacter sp. JC074]|uniref:GNAT family N-acetyltransferase n=1 Tax=Acidaminobacter sp. JC074 TaxID=2530199 RepID=UPI001F11810D|nr:GNAT family N-acetyltransferase [Acidaminobacter sp. JC074]MCH4886125.1 GNAT family N-acetyltransferase [Acidaminobacter sp. JC074]